MILPMETLKFKPKNMQRNKKYLLQFTKRGLNGSTVQQPKPSKTAIQSANFYRSINNLPLNKFIDCIVNKNYAALIIIGFPTQDELLEAWGEILQQYSDAIGDAEYRFYANKLKELTILTLTYNCIQTLVDVLSKEYNKDLCNELNKLGSTNFKFDYSNKAEYQNSLLRCLNRSKGLKISIDLLQIQVNEIEKKLGAKKVETPTEQYYQSTLITLSDYAKYPIYDSITVFEFCERIKRYNNYCEQFNKQTNGRRINK